MQGTEKKCKKDNVIQTDNSDSVNDQNVLSDNVSDNNNYNGEGGDN